MEINIDSKEPLEYKIQALESGDIRFKIRDYQIIIERKEWRDLINSHRNNRLAIQLNQMTAPNTLGILAVVGYPESYGVNVSRAYIRNLMFSIFLLGIKVERLENEADYKKRIPELIEYLKNGHTSLIPNRYSNPKLGALMWVAGIGYVKANKLLEIYQGSLIDIYNSPKQALAKILGDTLADRFFTSIHKPVKTATKEDYDLWQ
jgi:ERCC4-type nuclease